MLYAKFQDLWTISSVVEYFEDFYHIWAWRPSWSCDLNHLHKLSFLLSMEAPHKNLALIGQAVSMEKMFENGGHVHVYSAEAGVDNYLGSNNFHLPFYSVNIVLCCKFSPIK